MGTRQSLAEAMIPAIVAKWREHGDDVLDRLIVEEPKAFAQLAANLLPKEVQLSVEQKLPGNLDPEAWAKLHRVIDLIEAYAPVGAEPAEIFGTIERALVTAYAEPKQIEQSTFIIAPPPY
jgi:hypothetical protein